jgi:hypothetical protein
MIRLSDGLIGEQTNEIADLLRNGQMNEQTDRGIAKWTGGHMNRQMERWTGKWMGSWKGKADAQTDLPTYTQIYRETDKKMF